MYGPGVADVGEGVTEGYLVLGDISGYTAFLTGTELEHSHAIITELMRLLRAKLCPPLHFVKLEGDAVFCFAPHDAFPDPEQLLELVEATYFDFHSRLLDMARSTTCECDACRAIDGLDLKFVAHRGTFVVDRDLDDRLDLAGPDVILAHRLLKNTVIESGGPESYAFFTDECLSGRLDTLDLPSHQETYESFGSVCGRVQDLAAVESARREAQRVRLTDDDADLVASYVVDAPPAVCWQYFVEPGKRLRHMGAIETGVEFSPNGDGRLGRGASSHCAHGMGGDGLREYLDWRPYEYFTCRFSPIPEEGVDDYLFTDCIETYEFRVLDDGRTEHRWLVRNVDRSADGMAEFADRTALMVALAASDGWGDQMRIPIAEDADAWGLGPADPPRGTDG